MPGKFITATTLVATFIAFGSVRANTQAPPEATFRSSVDLVRVSAVVRDRKGRFVQDLTHTFLTGRGTLGQAAALCLPGNQLMAACHFFRIRSLLAVAQARS